MTPPQSGRERTSNLVGQTPLGTPRARSSSPMPSSGTRTDPFLTRTPPVHPRCGSITPPPFGIPIVDFGANQAQQHMVAPTAFPQNLQASPRVRPPPLKSEKTERRRFLTPPQSGREWNNNPTAHTTPPSMLRATSLSTLPCSGIHKDVSLTPTPPVRVHPTLLQNTPRSYRDHQNTKSARSRQQEQQQWQEQQQQEQLQRRCLGQLALLPLRESSSR